MALLFEGRGGQRWKKGGGGGELTTSRFYSNWSPCGAVYIIWRRNAINILLTLPSKEEYVFLEMEAGLG